jgi:hypothetical protein
MQTCPDASEASLVPLRYKRGRGPEVGGPIRYESCQLWVWSLEIVQWCGWKCMGGRGGKEMDRCLLTVLSTLYIWIGLVRGCVGMLLSFAHSMSMKQPVAPQSMRACVHHLTTVSINSISTSTVGGIGPGLAATTYLMGNQCSQAGQW